MAPPRPTVPDGVDLLDPGFFSRPDAPEIYARLRRDFPVAFHPSPRGGFWAVSRHADVVKVARSPDVFVSGRGTGPSSRFDAPFDPDEPRAFRPPFLSLNQSDRPVHAQLRALVAPALSPRALAGLVPSIDERARALVDQAIERGEGDLVESVASVLPLGIACDLLGFSPDEAPLLLSLTRRVARADDPDHRDPSLSSAASWARAERELMELLGSLDARWLAAPGEGELRRRVLTGLVEGAPLGERDRLFLLRLLVSTSHETTAHALASSLLALADHPSELERLISEPSRVATAVDELLRWSSPLARLGRFASRAAEVGGVTIGAGERVVMLFRSANHDEAVFERPSALDLGRPRCPHLAFGEGPHRCPGATLVRMQLGAVLGRLVERGARVEIVERPRVLRSSLTTGPVSLRARLIARG